MSRKIVNVIKAIPLYLACFLIVLLVYKIFKFNEVTFEQILYGLINTDGVSTSGIHEGAKVTLIFGTILFSLLLIILIKLKKSYFKYGNILLILVLIVGLNSISFFTYIYNQFSTGDLYEKYYVDPRSVTITFPDVKQNLIYIFLESTEMSNVSKDNGGAFEESYMPNLEKIALDNINFSNTDKLGGITQVYGTGYTTAGMVSQTSGINYKLKLDKNLFQRKYEEINGVTTLGDILLDNGYHNYLMLGSYKAYGGRGAYFKEHGDYQIFDYEYAIETSKIDEDYYVWWGYEDNKLYSFAKEKLLEIASNGGPFNFTMLTVDTHFTDGYLDNNCYDSGDSHYGSVFLCEDKMLGDFITWIKAQEFYDNTTIILVGDHLTMQSNFYKNIDKDYDRVVYNAIINSRTNDSNSKNRLFTSMDMFPTTLASLGVDIPGDRLGLGVNLYSDELTLLEELGYDKLNRELSKKSNYYNNKFLIVK